MWLAEQQTGTRRFSHSPRFGVMAREGILWTPLWFGFALRILNSPPLMALPPSCAIVA